MKLTECLITFACGIDKPYMLSSSFFLLFISLSKHEIHAPQFEHTKKISFSRHLGPVRLILLSIIQILKFTGTIALHLLLLGKAFSL